MDEIYVATLRDTVTGDYKASIYIYADDKIAQSKQFTLKKCDWGWMLLAPDNLDRYMEIKYVDN